MKRVIAITLLLCLVLGGCGKKDVVETASPADQAEAPVVENNIDKEL